MAAELFVAFAIASLTHPNQLWASLIHWLTLGILCFAVAPGFTVSEMTEEYLQGRGGAQIVADIPLGRVATTDEVAEVIRWLAIDAPASATGSIIDVNGASYVR